MVNEAHQTALEHEMRAAPGRPPDRGADGDAAIAMWSSLPPGATDTMEAELNDRIAPARAA